jgi:drug/metabolite transporter (DMT)-like permease
MRFKADQILLLVAILWGSAFAAQRVAGMLGSVHYFNAARFLVAALILVPFAAKSPISRAQVGWTCAAGTILFLASAVQQAGILTTTTANAGFLTSLYVVIVPLVLWLGWKENPSMLSLAAIALAAVGAYLLSTGGRFHAHAGDILDLAGAAF